jgi:hypothetical protein
MSSIPSSSTCKPFQQDEQHHHQQQQQQQQQQLQSSNIVMKSFPWKLYLLLERCEYEKRIYQTPTHAIQWNISNGKSFIIQNKEKFTNEILPHFFKETKDNTNDNDGNFDIFQTNIDMWYVLCSVALCCVLLCALSLVIQ